MNTPAARPRATDDQRHQATEELGAALSRGQLTIAEFEERTMAAIRATYADELPALLADVPPHRPHTCCSFSPRTPAHLRSAGFVLVGGGFRRYGALPRSLSLHPPRRRFLRRGGH